LTSDATGSDSPAAADAQGAAEDRPLRDASLVKRIYRDPDHAPEVLVLTAVEKVGPRSGSAVAQLRRASPGASPRELGEQVVARTVRIVRTDGAIMGTPFLAPVVPAFIAVLWHQAQTVLRLAALSGRDPTEAGRAGEVLLLQGALSRSPTRMPQSRKPSGDRGGGRRGPASSAGRASA
jgi:hypothetical protein